MRETEPDHRHTWAADKMQVGTSCMDCSLNQSDWFFDEQRRLAAEVAQLRAWNQTLEARLDQILVLANLE